MTEAIVIWIMVLAAAFRFGGETVTAVIFTLMMVGNAVLFFFR